MRDKAAAEARAPEHRSMTMNATEHDPFLDAAAAGPEALALTEKEVSALIQISVRKLQQMREANITPPHWKKIGKSVRYSARLLKEWMDAPDDHAPHAPITATQTISAHERSARVGDRPTSNDGYDEPLFRGGRRKKVRHQSFAQFLSEGHLPDEWLFVLRGPHGRPVDWSATLNDADRNDEDDVMWLNLSDYLTRLEIAARSERADAARNGLETLEPGKPFQAGRL